MNKIEYNDLVRSSIKIQLRLLGPRLDHRADNLTWFHHFFIRLLPTLDQLICLLDNSP